MCLWAMVHTQWKYITLSIGYMAMHILWVPYYHIHTKFSQCLCVYGLWYMHNANILPCQLSIWQCTYHESHTITYMYTDLSMSMGLWAMGHPQCKDITLPIAYMQCTYYGSHTITYILCSVNVDVSMSYGIYTMQRYYCQLSIWQCTYYESHTIHTYWVQSMSMCLWAMVHTQCKYITLSIVTHLHQCTWG